MNSLHDEFGSWDRLVERLQHSPNRLEREHYFFGAVNGTGQPLLIHDPLVNSHLAVTGATRSGKSSRGILPLMIQAIRRRKHSLWFFDLKGDRAAFGALGTNCRKAKVNFRWFTTESGRSSYVFNPFCQSIWQLLTANQRGQLLLASLSLDFGDTDSGPAYFGSQGERLLGAAFKENPQIASFADLQHVLADPDLREKIGMSRRDFENTGQVQASVTRLASVTALNFSDRAPASECAITIEEMLSKPGVAYFWLPITIESATARTLPRLVIRMLVAAARLRDARGLQTYIVIDEAQETLQRSMSPVIKQARDLGISVWMAFQNLSDLEAAGQGMSDIVLGNTSIRVFFSATDPTGRAYLSLVSGEFKRTLRGRGKSVTETPQGVNVGESSQSSEAISPRLSQEDINYLNATEGLCIVEASPKSGYTRLHHPAFVRTPFFCTAKQFDAYTRTPWPAANRFTVQNNLAVTSSPPVVTDTTPASGVPTPLPPSKESLPIGMPTKISSESPNVLNVVKDDKQTSDMAAYLMRLADEDSIV